MRRKKGRRDTSGDWIFTYSDMVTLLLCFFVLMYSMSTLDMNRWMQVVKSLNKNAEQTETIPFSGGEAQPEEFPGGLPEGGLEAGRNSMEEIYLAMKRYVDANHLAENIQLYKGEGYAFVVFRNDLFFDGDSYALRPRARSVLDAFCESIAPHSEKIQEIRVLGHTTQGTANRLNNPQDDRFLSSNRATNVLLYIQNKDVIGADKLISEGLGQFHPVAPFDTEENRSKNRRVEILLTDGTYANITLGDIYRETGILDNQG